MSLTELESRNLEMNSDRAKKMFFVILTHIRDCSWFFNKLFDWLLETKCILYGIHFQYKITDFSPKKDFSLKKGMEDSEITCFADTAVYSDCFPVLLYMIHLALGENAHQTEIWSLADVFNETASVLKGLSERCCLELLSKLDIEDEKTETKDISIDKIKDNTSEEILSNLDINEPKTFNDPSITVLDNNLKDLPLMANVNEVLVYHYVLNLDVNFNEKQILGTEILFLKPASDEVAKREFQMCLDCTLIDIESVVELELPEDFDLHFHQESCCCSSSPSDLPTKQPHNITKAVTEHSSDNTPKQPPNLLKTKIGTEPHSTVKCNQLSGSTTKSPNVPKASYTKSSSIKVCKSCQLLRQQNNFLAKSTQTSLSSATVETKSLNYRTLPYAVYGWCLRVWNVPSSKKHWPKCVVIKYKTKPIGPSLAWCKDQDGKYVKVSKCCWTINFRIKVEFRSFMFVSY